jgi:hypothetical protein
MNTQEKAQTVLEALEVGDPRGRALVHALAQLLQIHPQLVLLNIFLLSVGEEVNT